MKALNQRLVAATLFWGLCSGSLFGFSWLDDAGTTDTPIEKPETFEVPPPSGIYHEYDPRLFPLQKIISIGDSWSAGVGAGERLAMWCERYDHAFIELINLDPRLGWDPKVRDDQRGWATLACSGALLEEVVGQLGHVKGHDTDILTITGGANDYGLLKILNSCIYGILEHDDCEGRIYKAQELIANTIPDALDELLEKVKTKLKVDTGRAYWVGYAKLFNAETEWCNNVVFCFWDDCQNAKYDATVKRRRQLNDLTERLNNAIQGAIIRADDPRIVWVPIDRDFEALNGRFCEEGVKEMAPDRKGLMFFEMRGDHGQPCNDDVARCNSHAWEPEKKPLLKRGPHRKSKHNHTSRDVAVEEDQGLNRPTTSGARIEDFIIEAYIQHPNRTLSKRFGDAEWATNLTDAITAHQNLLHKRNFWSGLYRLIPSLIKRITQPTITAHNLIANKIMEAIEADRGRRLLAQDPCMEFSARTRRDPADAPEGCVNGHSTLPKPKPSDTKANGTEGTAEVEDD